MNENTRMVIKGVFIICAILFAAYVAYVFYNYAIKDATQRIKQGVSQGVSKGVVKGVGETVNPLSWPKRAFGA